MGPLEEEMVQSKSTTDRREPRVWLLATWIEALSGPRGREVDLDVVRGIAILLAMGWHVYRPTSSWFVEALQYPGHTFGWAGVDLFFVLSGFLVGRLVFREHVKTGDFNYARFFTRRAFKLWPVLYIFLIVSVVMSGEPWIGFLPQIGLHLQNYFTPSQAHHLWSLAVEEHFYLLFGAAFPLFMRKHSISSVELILVAVLVAGPVLRALGLAAGFTPVQLQIQTQFRIDALACGVLLALWSVHRVALFDKIVARKVPLTISIAIGLVFLINVSKVGHLGIVLGYTVSYITGAAFLLAIYRSGIEKIPLGIPKVLSFLGIYSYSMYIWHVAVNHILAKFLGGISQGAALAITYIAIVGGAAFVTILIERPMLALRDRVMPSPVVAT
ncbi:acyltransferase family protein [Caulobacter segnis]